ncbi:chemotaxis protein CheB [Pedobacter rhodius]|uniref:histidine kinase n=1 Tax=Pedobacter rhodius TaxID=3004098 RepID=A0ABT4KWR5_9SPHI|nr:chemotaxis protein CheB [Pedobacter sp. SJ11]MCZ4223371.1 ATP-binding protein [Pedobacter sp. SJ11]
MKEPEYIIAIGASAGGLEEITVFFDHTPLDGVSYVIVQHLSAEFKSRMTEVLSKHSKLSVEQATEGMLVECNRVYLIPNDKFMTIRDNRLFLTPKEKISSPHLTINTFFESLALDSGRRAIGIVLSGLGSDGAEGITCIKREGGMVMARDPETSAFPSMPYKSISTGMVDFILEPASMPGAIEDYVKYEGILKSDTAEDSKYLAQIIELIRERSPLDFSDYKSSTILRRTKRRAAYNNLGTLRDYLFFLRDTPSEIESLSKDFLISVTAFFRDSSAFEFLETNIVPRMLEKLMPREELKIWVAGCATGEEVYSLAIIICEQLKGIYENTAVKIFATDIDSKALAHAGKGFYQKDAVKNVSAERLENYFIAEGEGYKIKTSLRKLAIFAQHDLVKNPPYCNMHLISCRNLLIYMAPVLQKKVFGVMLFGLKQDGYLFLGSSENPMPIIKNLETVSKAHKIYRNLKSKHSVSFDAFSIPESITARRVSSNFTLAGGNNGGFHLADAMQENLAHELNVLVVCIDEQQNVIKSYGNTSRFLLPKHFTTDLETLLPKKLAMVYHSLRNNVLKSNEKLTLNRIKVKHNEEFLRVNLSLTPLANGGSGQKLMMVTFSEDHTFAPLTPEGNEFDEKKYHDEYTLNLEEEVKILKEKLNATYEQLDASNENMQSFNEEMISANEEMQSTNEEMQSVNEELDTINSEYQLKNKELSEINDDLNNYFRSNLNGQLFINNELLLMKFSPGTIKQINLLESDIGRPLSNITTNIKFETLTEDIRNVLDNGTVITKEIETNNGKWYQVMTMPYVRQSDQKNSGAIITFNDITELKEVQKKLDNSNKMLGMAIDADGTGTWSVKIETGEFSASQRFKNLFGFTDKEEVSYLSAVSRIKDEFRAIFEQAVDVTVKTGQRFDIEFAVSSGDNRFDTWVRAIGSLVLDGEKKPAYFTGVVNDITIHKQDEVRKNDFIAMVSHELRSPLTILQAYIQLLKSKADKPDFNFTVSALEKASIQIRKMTTLIKGFLSVSSFESGRIKLNRETFEMNGLVSETIYEILFLAPVHTIALKEGPLCKVNGDRDKIGQVISNYISNAIKYNIEERPIEIEVSCTEDIVQVSVADLGLGIHQNDQHRLFERYSRIDTTSTKTIAGFGLGLYLSSEIISRHNGKVWVESEPGKGSKFYFNLPKFE